MAAWPTLEELKLTLGVTTDVRDVTLTRALGAAIEQVGVDVGYRDVAVDDLDAAPELTGWIDYDDADPPAPDVVTVTPNESLAQAALLLAVTAMKAPDAPFGVAAIFDTGGIYVARQNPNYLRLLKGSRRRFGVA
jgi:hypothetical protein